MTLVSVVIPMFNVANYLQELLDSIAGQTHRELDVVIVDNGASDGSERIAARFAAVDPRFRVVQALGGGAGR
ncbi:MAG: CDP-glycerol glycerophosphotransferase, partial [Frankiaceae bacterium]|nr:CDP-glycerol glycerophosphotransferase [Frankiaceae bacterium]